MHARTVADQRADRRLLPPLAAKHRSSFEHPARRNPNRIHILFFIY
jgi:hypothetical protein